MNRNRNNGNNNWRQNRYQNERRFNNNYSHYNRDNNQNNFNNGSKSLPNEKKPINESNVKPNQCYQYLKDCDSYVNQMPGIRVNRSLSSSPPFIGLPHHQNDGSGDKTQQQLDQIANKLSSIDLTDSKDIKPNKESEPMTESVLKTESKNNEENESVITEEKTFRYRRNTTGSADHFRYTKRYHRNFNNNNNNNNNNGFHYNYNNNKFYPNNNRINSSHKYESQNQSKGYQLKSYATVSSMNTSGGDYAQNHNYSAPNMYYMPFDPYYNSCTYFIPNQYPFYSMANQSTAYPSQQSIASNTDESNAQMTTNAKQSEIDKQSVKDINYPKSNANGNAGNSNNATFIPFQWSPQMPAPPVYYGYIHSIDTGNGLFRHYFVCQIPPNIAPLLLEADSNGTPILPSNCFQI